MNIHRIALSALALIGLAGIAIVGADGAGTAAGPAMPTTIKPYDHIIEIMMENSSYGTIIGNSGTPANIHLASTYGLATDNSGMTHPSEPNYITNIAGDHFGVQDDNQCYSTVALTSTDSLCAGITVDHTDHPPTIADQLTAAGKTWKGDFQSLPPTPPAGQLVTTGPTADGPYTIK